MNNKDFSDKEMCSEPKCLSAMSSRQSCSNMLRERASSMHRKAVQLDKLAKDLEYSNLSSESEELLWSILIKSQR